MTREEELDWLCRLRSEIYVYMPKEWLIPMNNALDMAISDLSAIEDIKTEINECYRQADDIAYAEGLEMAELIIDEHIGKENNGT